jgi:L-lactate dehydrogenase (cytochrome)
VRQDKLQALPPLDEILSLHDFEALAKETMSDKAWAYYSSGADDEITMVCFDLLVFERWQLLS